MVTIVYYSCLCSAFADHPSDIACNTEKDTGVRLHHRTSGISKKCEHLVVWLYSAVNIRPNVDFIFIL